MKITIEKLVKAIRHLDTKLKELPAYQAVHQTSHDDIWKRITEMQKGIDTISAIMKSTNCEYQEPFTGKCNKESPTQEGDICCAVHDTDLSDGSDCPECEENELPSIDNYGKLPIPKCSACDKEISPDGEHLCLPTMSDSIKRGHTCLNCEFIDCNDDEPPCNECEYWNGFIPKKPFRPRVNAPHLSNHCPHDAEIGKCDVDGCIHHPAYEIIPRFRDGGAFCPQCDDEPEIADDHAPLESKYCCAIFKHYAETGGISWDEKKKHWRGPWFTNSSNERVCFILYHCPFHGCGKELE